MAGYNFRMSNMLAAIGAAQVPKIPEITRRRQHNARVYDQAFAPLVARVAQTIKRDFRPDVVVAHIGWGERLYLRDVFPDARIVAYCEFFYHAEGHDVGFDPEFPAARDAALHLRTRNATQLLSLDAAHRGISPTAWQRGVFPASQLDKIAVIHDGIDVARVSPDREARFLLSDGRSLHAGDPVVTYVARNLEPYRGFHVFMRALPQILKHHRRAQVVIEQATTPRFPDVSADELRDAWADIMKRAKLHQHHKISREQLSVREYMSVVLRQLQGQLATSLNKPLAVEDQLWRISRTGAG